MDNKEYYIINQVEIPALKLTGNEFYYDSSTKKEINNLPEITDGKTLQSDSILKQDSIKTYKK